MIHHFFNTLHFIPDYHENTVYDIDFKALYQNGIRLLLIDLDNTLIPYDQSIPHQELHDFFEGLNTMGFETIIVSNNHKARIKLFANAVETPFIASAKKPLKRGFKKAIKLAKKSYKKEEICMIGDQIMTDVYGAKRLKLQVVLVLPIKKKSEKWYTKVNRYLENRILRRIEKEHPNTYQNLDLKRR
jgi:uncharacterized protein